MCCPITCEGCWFSFEMIGPFLTASDDHLGQRSVVQKPSQLLYGGLQQVSIQVRAVRYCTFQRAESWQLSSVNAFVALHYVRDFGTVFAVIHGAVSFISTRNFRCFVELCPFGRAFWTQRKHTKAETKYIVNEWTCLPSTSMAKDKDSSAESYSRDKSPAPNERSREHTESDLWLSYYRWRQANVAHWLTIPCISVPYIFACWIFGLRWSLELVTS